MYESIKMDMRRLQVDYQFLGRQIMTEKVETPVDDSIKMDMRRLRKRQK